MPAKHSGGSTDLFGSPSYLMQTYGQGYLFTVKVDPNSRFSVQSDVIARIEQSLPGATLMASYADKDSHKLNLKYRIALDGNDGITLSKVFRTLSDLLEEKAIEDFEVTRSSLEQVFVSFAALQHKSGSGDAQVILS